MSDLEGFIRENRALFEDQNPPEGHLERFTQRVRPRTRMLRFRPVMIVKAAAVLVMLLLSGLWVVEHLTGPTDARGWSKTPLAQADPEMAETEFFLTSTIDRRMTELREFGPEGQRISENIQNQEFRQMDSLLQALTLEYQTKPSDPRIIDAMVVQYQTRIGILDRILKELKTIQTKNKKNHENTEI